MTSSFIHKYANMNALVQIQSEMNSTLTTFSAFYTIPQKKQNQALSSMNIKGVRPL